MGGSGSPPTFSRWPPPALATPTPATPTWPKACHAVQHVTPGQRPLQAGLRHQLDRDLSIGLAVDRLDGIEAIRRTSAFGPNLTTPGHPDQSASFRLNIIRSSVGLSRNGEPSPSDQTLVRIEGPSSFAKWRHRSRTPPDLGSLQVMLSQDMPTSSLTILAQAAAGDRPWYSDVIGQVLGAVAVAALTFMFTWGSMKTKLGRENRELESQLESLRRNLAAERYQTADLRQQLQSSAEAVKRLSAIERKYQNVRAILEASGQVRDLRQPVLLLGPRNVGKTSLLMQWHSPWDIPPVLESTERHKSSTVPVYDHESLDAVRHFADKDILTKEHIHFALQVHDFPGEPHAQPLVIEIAKKEVRTLRERTGKILGVVLICMFNAEEAATGIDSATNTYYNGDMFVRLRRLVGEGTIAVQRLIVVFNKVDLLAKRLPRLEQTALLDRCEEAFREPLDLLYRACDTEKIHTVLTTCDRDLVASQGTTVVLSEAARGLVIAIAGPMTAVQALGKEYPTTTSSHRFTIPAVE